MEKITSFTVDHDKLNRGIYVSRKDKVGNEIVTTFDIRLKFANREPVLDIPAMHTMEHLAATYLRNNKKWGERTIYFGPMGCRTGFYIIFHGNLKSKDVADVVSELFKFMADFNDEIPGITRQECGNYLSHDLPMAKWESKKFYDDVLTKLTEENLNYPV